MSWDKPSDYSGLDRLVGRTIVAVEQRSDIDIVFRTSEGARLYYQTEGDCCSRSWIEHLTVPDLLDGGVVTRVVANEMDEGLDSLDEGYLRFYLVAVATSRGEIIIEFRNSSNSYYGGDLRFVREI